MNGKSVLRTDTMHIPMAVSLDALRVFASVLVQYTDAAIVAISFSWEDSLDGEPTGDEPLGTLATLLFHGEVDKTRTKNFSLFAAKEDMFEVVQGEGLLVKRDVGQELADAYGTLTGETFQFIRGRLQR